MPKPIVIQPGDRALFTGRTGSGKTYAAGRYLKTVADKQPGIIIDPKGMFDWQSRHTENAPIATKFDEVVDYSRESRIIFYRPDIENDVVEETNELLRAVYRKTDVFVYIDELYGVGNGDTKFPRFLNAIYTRGRQRLITILACVQRPAWVPRFTISENTHHFLFDLDLPDDRGLMAGIMGERARISPIEATGKEYSFWYHNTTWPRGQQYQRPLRIND